MKGLVFFFQSVRHDQLKGHEWSKASEAAHECLFSFWCDWVAGVKKLKSIFETVAYVVLVWV
ncbi:hypothetical protein [Photobacterium sp. R1]